MSFNYSYNGDDHIFETLFKVPLLSVHTASCNKEHKIVLCLLYSYNYLIIFVINELNAKYYYSYTAYS